MSSSILTPIILSLPLFLVAAIVFIRLRHPSRVNLIRLCILTFVLHFGIYPMISFTLQSLSTGLNFSFDDYLKTYLMLYLYLLGMLTVLLFINPKQKSKRKYFAKIIDEICLKLSKKKLFFIWLIIMGVLLVKNYSYGYTYYGSATMERNLSIPYWLIIFETIIDVFLYGFVAYGLYYVIRFRKIDIIVFLFIISKNILLFGSRTYIISIFVLYLLLYLITSNFRLPLKKIGSLIIFVGILAVFVFPLLQSFRGTTTSMSWQGKAIDYTVAFEQAWEADQKDLEKNTIENLIYRTNFIERIIELQNFPEEKGFMEGLNITSQFLYVIPRFLFPEKVLLNDQLSNESVIFYFYGEAPYDVSDNLPLHSYMDFGFLGAFLGGVFFALVLLFFEWFFYQIYPINSFIALSLLFYVLYTFLTHEQTYTGLFSMVRQCIIIFCCCLPFKFLYRFNRNKVLLTTE